MTGSIPKIFSSPSYKSPWPHASCFAELASEYVQCAFWRHPSGVYSWRVHNWTLSCKCDVNHACMRFSQEHVLIPIATDQHFKQSFFFVHHLLSIVWKLPGILLASHLRVWGNTPCEAFVVGSILPDHCIICRMRQRLWLWDGTCSKSPRLETDEIFERLLFMGILQKWPWSRKFKIIFWNGCWRIIQKCEMENSQSSMYDIHKPCHAFEIYWWSR